MWESFVRGFVKHFYLDGGALQVEKKKLVAQPKKTNVISLQMDATFFFERAVQSLDRYHYDKALKYFRRAVEYEPDNAVNHCNMAGILSEMGNYEESNAILEHILEQIDPNMFECHFYMANNYANMELFEKAEHSILIYLEQDPKGDFMEECEEMLEFLSFELERPAPISKIKSREEFFEHDKARMLLEEGKFSEAVRVLKKVVKKYPDFLAARNNLALAYYYMGQFDKAMQMIQEVLEIEVGNLHALCNLAIFYQHSGVLSEAKELMEFLRKTIPFHHEHVFKLATTMGILGEHSIAYQHFKRLLGEPEFQDDPCLYHYTAVAAANISRFNEARRYWKQADQLDDNVEVARFYLNVLEDLAQGKPMEGTLFHYHYHLPFEEQFRILEQAKHSTLPEHIKKDPLVRSSFFWALRHGDRETKLQVIQAFSHIADKEVELALRDFIAEGNQEDDLKKIALFVLRSMNVLGPLETFIDGKKSIDTNSNSSQLAEWNEDWQLVLSQAFEHMQPRYDMIQQYDMQTLWVEFIHRSYPAVPHIHKVAGWSAALEYLTAKMHRRTITYQEVSQRYKVSVSTIRKNVKWIDEACGLKEKMDSIFSQFPENL
jgi:tetratricopeptide (TPR) repeat protein